MSHPHMVAKGRGGPTCGPLEIISMGMGWGGGAWDGVLHWWCRRITQEGNPSSKMKMAEEAAGCASSVAAAAVPCFATGCLWFCFTWRSFSMN